MDAVELVGVGVAEAGGYAGADVAAGGGETGVAEVLGHQLGPEVGDLADFHSGPRRCLGEAEAGERWGDYVEGVGGVGAVGGGVCQ